MRQDTIGNHKEEARFKTGTHPGHVSLDFPLTCGEKAVG